MSCFNIEGKILMELHHQDELALHIALNHSHPRTTESSRRQGISKDVNTKVEERDDGL